MLKFKYYHTGEYHPGFARRYYVDGRERFLIILSDGRKLTIEQAVAHSNGNTWRQVPRESETKQSDDLIRALGIGLETARKI